MSNKLNNRNVIETLEGRRLLSSTDFGAPTFIAVANVSQNFGVLPRGVNYFDVSDIDEPGFGGLNDLPAFSIGAYEDANGFGNEEVAAVTVNPTNGDTYFLGTDGGTPGNTSGNDQDVAGDYDVYRFDFASVYNDFVGNNRPAGALYVPSVGPDGFDYNANYGSFPDGPTGLPGVFAGLFGIPADRDNTDADPSNDIVFLDGAVDKIAEVPRPQTNDFYNERTLEFIDSGKLLLLDRTVDEIEDNPDTVDVDESQPAEYGIFTIERVGATQGLAREPGDAGLGAGELGGYNGLENSESWEIFELDGELELDGVAGSLTQGDLDGISYADVEGVQGFWAADRDGGGDTLAFFELDFAARSFEKAQFQFIDGNQDAQFLLDEDPTVDAGTNDGELDVFDVDENGDLIIVESGFFPNVDGGPQEELRVITRDIVSYAGGDTDMDGRTEILPGGYTVSDFITPTLDDDTGVTDGRYSFYERGKNQLYIFDRDGGSLPAVTSDLYVFDLDTNTIVYEELDAFNNGFFINGQNYHSFTLGDAFLKDGLVTPDDVDAYYVAAQSGSLLAQENLDLTGDDVITLGTGEGTDSEVLIRDVIGTAFADFNLDGTVSILDFARLRAGFGSGSLYSQGDANGDGTVSILDFAILRGNFGFNANSSTSLFAEAEEAKGRRA